MSFIQRAFAIAVLSNVVLAVDPTVKINSTTIIGHQTGVKSDAGVPIAEYLGIPYAPKPLRFAKATPYSLPPGNFVAANYTPICNQLFPGPNGPATKALFTTGNPPESEDCLSVNVWTPQVSGKTPVAKSLPVLVWFFGGALLFGGSGQPLYNGTTLASHDIVLVTLNYRTNLFGFPGASQIETYSQNLGLLDQRLALGWIRSNIGAFGGDPARITIFGESAGAVSVESLLLQGPATNPPFRAAIQDSGVSSRFTVRPIGPLFSALASAVGCNQTGSAQINCMRAVPAAQLTATAAQLNLPFGVVVDNSTFFADPYARRASGRAAKVPSVIGSNQDDGKLFVLGVTNFTDFVITQFPGAPLAAVKALYPIGPTKKYPNDFEAAAAAFRDATFQCKARIDGAIHATHVGKAFRYLYQAVFANQQPIPNAGAYHSAELALAFGNLPPGSTAKQVQLSKTIHTAAAAYTKNPTSGLVGWPSLTGSTTDKIVVVANDTVISLQSQDNYDGACKSVWDTYLLSGRSLKEFANLV